MGEEEEEMALDLLALAAESSFDEFVKEVLEKLRAVDVDSSRCVETNARRAPCRSRRTEERVNDAILASRDSRFKFIEISVFFLPDY